MRRLFVNVAVIVLFPWLFAQLAAAARRHGWRGK